MKKLLFLGLVLNVILPLKTNAQVNGKVGYEHDSVIHSSVSVAPLAYSFAMSSYSPVLQVNSNTLDLTIDAACKGNACNFVDLTATFDSEHNITSITISNVKNKPVNIQVELSRLFNDIKPWSRYKIGANSSKTFNIGEALVIGASIKRANVIED